MSRSCFGKERSSWRADTLTAIQRSGDSGVEPALAHLTGRLEDPQPDGSDEPGILGQRHGNGSRDQPIGRVLPTDKRFHAHNPAGPGTDLRLKFEEQPFAMPVVVLKIRNQTPGEGPRVVVVVKATPGRVRCGAGAAKQAPKGIVDLFYLDFIGYKYKRRIDEHTHHEIRQLQRRTAQRAPWTGSR